MVAPSKRNCRIARAPKRVLGAHTEWFCSMKVAIWQVCSRHIQRRLNHRIRAGTPAQGASITSTTTRPWPCAIQPTPRAASKAITGLYVEHQSLWGASHAHQMEALQIDEQITPITTIKRRTAAGRVRHRPRSLDDSGGRSPLIIKDLDLYPQPPTNTRSPTLNSEEPFKPPDPRRDPGPGRVDHLHHHATVALCDSAHTQGSQQGNHRTLCRAPEPVRCEPRSSNGSPPNRRADHTDHNDQATQNSSR